MNGLSLFHLWKRDKSNLSLTLDTLASFNASTAAEDIKSFHNELPKTLSENIQVCIKSVELNIRRQEFDTAFTRCESYKSSFEETSHFTHLQLLSLFLRGDFQHVIEISQTEDIHENTKSIVARSMYFLGQLPEAIALLMTINDKTPEDLGLLAMLHLDTEQLEQAQQFAGGALSSDPQQFDALLAVASIECAALNFNEALPLISRCLELQPNSGRSLSLLARVKLYDNQTNEAIAILAKAIETMPDHIGTWHMLGWAYYTQNNFNQALQAFEESLGLDRNFGESYGAIACCLLQLDNLEKAQENLQVAVRLNKASFSAIYAQAILLEKQGKKEESQKIIDTVLAKQEPTLGVSYAQLVAQKLSS